MKNVVTVKPLSELQVEINKIFHQIDSTIPKTIVTDKEETTSAKHSKAFLKNPKTSYCVGDQLIIQVDMYDWLRRKKTYGGDYLRARMFTSEIGAAASGRIEDFNNGTYHIHFTLFWEGMVTISILVMHPSEGASALWTYRNKGHGYVDHLGKFTKPHQEKEVNCGFELNTTQELCEYANQREEEYFYCTKPKDFSCESLSQVKSVRRYDKTLFTTSQHFLFNTSNVRVEIPRNFDIINVRPCSKNTSSTKEKCKSGMKLEYPSGYVMKGIWYPKSCSMLAYKSLENMATCMQRKFIHLLGDSTLNMWMLYFRKHVKTLTPFQLYEDNWAHQVFSLDLKRNMKITWKRHTFPFISGSFQSWKEERTIASEIDLIRGDNRTVIVLNIGVHFRAYPIFHFIRRLLNIRRAIERLFLRSPDTKVIIKTENTSAMKEYFETMSDFHASVQYLINEIIFTDLNVGFVNGWDMTNAFDYNEIHPPEIVIENEVKLLMTYIC
ncbi:NXPE family member 2-like [Hyperolius riggenbachi]|uniref:NXPE family member 2-like n=1 Tax=Hyperolius riggenbachi TaxID=752182 RepID=UPI0035A31B7C